MLLAVRADPPRFTVAAVTDQYLGWIGKTREQVLERGYAEALPQTEAGADDENAVRASLLQAFETGTPHHGKTARASFVSSPVRGRNAAIELIVVRFFEGADEGSRFLHAFTKAPVGMLVADTRGSILDVNQAFLEMLGFSHPEMISRNLEEFTHPDDRPLVRDFFTSLRDGSARSGNLEKRYLRKDAGHVWVRASIAAHHERIDREPEVVVIINDVTQRERSFRFLADNIPHLVWTAEPNGTLDYMNEAGADYFQAPRDALLTMGWLRFVHPDERSLARQRWKRSLETGEKFEISCRLRRGADGAWRCHLVRAVPLLSDANAVLRWFGTCTDIEEERRAEIKLRDQFQKFDTVLSHIPDFAYTFDTEGHFSYINHALLALWRMSYDQALGKNFHELGYPPELAARLQGQIQRVIRTGEHVRDRTLFTDPSGNTRNYEYILVPIFDSEGHIHGVAGSTRDITEGAEAAKQIEDDRRRWRELLQQAPAAIAILHGPDHRYAWVNDQYPAVVGRLVQTLIGAKVADVLAVEGLEVHLNLLDKVYTMGTPYVGHEARLSVFDEEAGRSKEVFVNFVCLPTRDAAGTIDGIFVHATDVTDMVLARKRVEESERQFRILAETIPHLAWIADDKGSPSWYNSRWYQYTGVTPGTMEGVVGQNLVDPEALPELLRRREASLATGEPFDMVFPLKGADGAFRSFLTRVEPVRDTEGNVVRWFGTSTDITEQRKTEEQLRRMNRELEEFAYVANHDLQEPLRMVKIYTELILATHGQPDNHFEQYAKFIRQGVTRMEALIHDLLEFSRVIHNDEVPRGSADLNAALAEATAVLRNRIEETGARIVADPLPVVQGDTGQLSYVFQNILSNSLKYRHGNRSPEIYISAEPAGEEWIISVRDNGIGFEPQYAERIFGLFKRLYKDEYPGTGLGLAICKRIVERYGGRMWAEGTTGSGAVFHFTLHAAPQGGTSA